MIEIWRIIPTSLEVSHNVQTEPSLLPVSSVLQRHFLLRLHANTTNDARLDIKTRGFWSRGQDTYFI